MVNIASLYTQSVDWLSKPLKVMSLPARHESVTRPGPLRVTDSRRADIIFGQLRSALGFGGRRVQRAEQTAYGEEAHPFNLAFQRAYRRFAQAHPTWVSRRFDDDFLRQALLTRQVTRQMTRPVTRPVSGLAQGRQPSGFVFIRPSDRALALAWDSHFGALAPDEALRSRHIAEVIIIANRFLTLLETEFGRLAAETANV